MWRRIASTTSGSTMKAMIRISAPQAGQMRGSISYTRLIKVAQRRRSVFASRSEVPVSGACSSSRAPISPARRRRRLGALEYAP